MTGTELLKLIEKYCAKFPQEMWFIRANVDSRHYNVKSLPKGFPDGFLLTKYNRLFFIETKSEREKQRPDQELFEARVKSMAFDYWIIRTFEEFMAKLKLVGVK